MADVSIACDPAALTTAQRRRYSALSQQLARAVLEVRELPDGYALRYATDEALWMLAAEFVHLERRCCPFFVFTLILDQHRHVWLQLTGQEGVKAFLTTELTGMTTRPIHGATV